MSPAASHSEEHDRLGIGGNNPPEPMLRERIEETYAEQFAKVEAIAKKANAMPSEITSDDEVAQIGDIVVEATKHANVLETLRKAEKEPYIRDGKIVDVTFSEGRIDRLSAIKSGLTMRVTAFNRAKAERLRREQAEAERKAREEAEQARFKAEIEKEFGDGAAAAEHNSAADKAEIEAAQIAQQPTKAADLTRVRSESGTVSSTKTEWKARVVDWEKIDLNKLRGSFKPAEVEKALRDHVRRHKNTIAIPGVEFFEEETAQFRG